MTTSERTSVNGNFEEDQEEEEEQLTRECAMFELERHIGEETAAKCRKLAMRCGDAFLVIGGTRRSS